MRIGWGAAPFTAFDYFQLALVLLCVALAFLRPSFLKNSLGGIEKRLVSVSNRPWACGLIVVLFPMALRLLLVPVYKPPAPFVHDEYAYLLQSDTFSSGRLANPRLPFPDQFESIYIFASPSYSSEYEPAQGFFLAIGQKVFGQPWAGVLLSMGLFCAVTYWAFLAWLPKVWAFPGALLMAVEIGVLSYWMNSYWGGCVPGIGGALMLGALARLRFRLGRLDAILLAVGVFVLVSSRPLEGILLSMVVAGFLLMWILLKKMTFADMLTGVALPLIAVLLPAALLLGYFNQRVTGKASEIPYLLYRAKYSIPPGFYWQKPPVAKAHLPIDIEGEYKAQLEQHERGYSLTGIVIATIGKLRHFWEFYIGILLTATLVALPFIWREPNMNIAFFALLVIVVFENLTYFAYFPHYSAAVATVAFLALTQCLRVLRGWGTRGLFLSRSIPLACCFCLGVAMLGRFLEPALPSSMNEITKLWSSEFEHEISRERFVPELQSQPGKQLILIHYDPVTHRNKDAWTFNQANLDTAKIVWARESNDPRENRRLIEYFKDRKVWLAEPDAIPQQIIPYPGLNR